MLELSAKDTRPVRPDSSSSQNTELDVEQIIELVKTSEEELLEAISSNLADSGDEQTELQSDLD